MSVVIFHAALHLFPGNARRETLLEAHAGRLYDITVSRSRTFRFDPRARSPPLKLLRSAVAATLKGHLAWRSKSAAVIYRTCRLGGRTIRSITDCMVAAAALHAQRPLLARDRDFRTIARYTELELVVPAAAASQP